MCYFGRLSVLRDLVLLSYARPAEPQTRNPGLLVGGVLRPWYQLSKRSLCSLGDCSTGSGRMSALCAGVEGCHKIASAFSFISDAPGSSSTLKPTSPAVICGQTQNPTTTPSSGSRLAGSQEPIRGDIVPGPDALLLNSSSLQSMKNIDMGHCCCWFDAKGQRKGLLAFCPC